LGRFRFGAYQRLLNLLTRFEPLLIQGIIGMPMIFWSLRNFTKKPRGTASKSQATKARTEFAEQKERQHSLHLFS